MTARRNRHDDYKEYDRVYEDDRVTFSKRVRLSSPKLPGGSLDLAALSYPSSGKLYSSPRQNTPTEAYDFKYDKLGNNAISKSGSLTKPSFDYAAEQIFEASAFFYIYSLSS